jgi:hypothetical protein
MSNNSSRCISQSENKLFYLTYFFFDDDSFTKILLMIDHASNLAQEKFNVKEE